MSSVDPILSATFQLCTQPKIDVIVTLTSTSLTCIAAPSCKSNTPKLPVIFLDDIVGCCILKSSRKDESAAYLKVVSYPKRKKFLTRKSLRRKVQHVFKAQSALSYQDNENVVHKWHLVISNLLDNVPVNSSTDLTTLKEVKKRHFLILINPFGGRGKAKQIFYEEAEPILKECNVSYDVVLTERANHAKEMMLSLDIKKYYGIITVSGDGLIHEVFNGLMKRPDWRDAVSIPFGSLPGGSSNALCCSINYTAGEDYFREVIASVSTYIIARHRKERMSLAKVDTKSNSFFSHLSVTWGLVADIDIESERLRLMGGARFSVTAVARLISDLSVHDQLCLNMTLNITKPHLSFMNLFAFDTPKQRGYGFLSVSWGIFADVDIESERFRSLGGARITIGGLVRLFNLRKYRGRLSFLPADDYSPKNGIWRTSSTSELNRGTYDRPAVPRSISVVGTKCTNLNAMARGDGVGDDLPPLTPPVDAIVSPDMQPSESSYNLIRVQNQTDGAGGSEGASKQMASSKVSTPLLPPLTEAVPKEWVTVEDDFITVIAGFLSHLDGNLMISPKAKLHNDQFNLVFIRSSQISKARLVSLFMNNMEDGSFLNDAHVESVMVKAFRLEPLCENGILTVDGERIEYGPVQAQFLPGIASVMAKTVE
ncbi:DgyrCDS5685 [Dimorphilus gyrociliatus]|uniref:sphingosine kinase n=1 Tax=Dimorphilus gyrociliatus TaxID=2664684 RepID=A0A7I8VKM4_9ANNE|nr:DgyrCDS5685 [Dimorphilus gyrociliatus]